MRLPSSKELKTFCLGVVFLAAASYGLLYLVNNADFECDRRSRGTTHVEHFSPDTDPGRPEKLLVIFTTFKEDSDHHVSAHRLVILNWVSHGPSIKPVLFSDQAPSNASDLPNLTQFALKNGWDVLPVPSRSRHGTPHLKAMYSVVFSRYKSMFYGYSNGDLLYEDGLVTSLHHLGRILLDSLKGNVLLVGRRKDVTLQVPPSLVNGNKSEEALRDFEVLSKRYDKSNLRSEAKGGTLRANNAIDYFFFTKDGSTFDWNATVDVVVGRRAYDQYLIAKAIDFKVTTIDMTKTTLAVHLSKPGVKNTGFLNADGEYNFNLIGKFNYDRGTTDTTTLYTDYEAFTNQVVLINRTSII